MDSIEIQAIEPVRSDSRSIVFVIACILAALCGLVLLGIGVYGAIAIFRGSPTSVGWMTAALATLGGAGLLVLEALAILRKSSELASVIATLFSAIAFIVLPPIVERILYQMSIPKVSSSATWGQVGCMTLGGLMGGFVGAAWFIEARRLSRRQDPETQPPTYAFPVIPPPETTPSVQ